MRILSTLLISLFLSFSIVAQEVIFDEFQTSTSSFSASFQFKDYYGFFFGSQNNQRNIWLSDGTAENTRSVAVAYNQNYYEVNQHFIFYMNRPNPSSGDFNLYRTDGDSSIFIKGGLSSLHNMSATDTLVFFFANNSLWRTNGYPNGTFPLQSHSMIPSDILSAFTEGNLFYFSEGDKLYVSDGTVQGTQLYFEPDSNITKVNSGIVFNGVRIYSACTETNGCELWRSDGTVTGTYMIKDLNPSYFNADTTRPGSSNPTSFKIINNQVFFKTGFENYWVTDGTEQGTIRLKTNENNLSNSEYWGLPAIPIYAELNGKLVFNTISREHGFELWISDGAVNGTHLIKDIHEGQGGINNNWSYYKNDATVVNGYLYFSANNGLNGIELWRTDGTEAGTEQLTDILPGIRSSQISHIGQSNSSVLFLGLKSYEGNELGSVLYKVSPNTFTVPNIETHDDDMEWYRQLGAFPYAKYNGDNFLNDVKLDQEENIYIVSTSSSDRYPISYPLNSFSLPRNPLLSTNNQSIISKFNANGDLLWAKYLGGSSTFRTSPQVEIDSDNNIIAGVGFYREAVFDSIVVNKNQGYRQGIGFAKYSSDGELKWLAYQNSTYTDYFRLYDIALDKNDNTYFLAQFEDGELNWEGFSLKSENDRDITFLGKLSANGELQWLEIVSDSTHWRKGLLQVHEENIIISLSQIDYISSFCNGVSYLNKLYQFNSEGQQVWEKSIESSDYSFIQNMDINDQGIIYIIGNYVGKLDFNDRNIKLDHVGICENYNSFLAKINQDGKIVQILSNPDRSIYSEQIYCEKENYYLVGKEYFEEGFSYEGYEDYFPDDDRQIFIEKYDYVNNLLGRRSFNKFTYAGDNPHLAIFNDDKVLLADISTVGLDTLSYFVQDISYTDNITLHKFAWEDNFPVKVYPDEENLTLKLAPNPSNGVTSVKIIDEAFQQYELSIFDVSGRLVHFHQKDDDFDYEFLHLNHLMKGMYFLQFKNPEGKTQVLKYIKL